MRARPRLVWIGPAALVLLAVAGPPLAGPAGIPSVAASAAQLLPPGTRVQEVRLEGGGFVRAPAIEVVPEGLRVGRDGRWRTLAAVKAGGPVRSTRLWLGTDHQGRSLLARTLQGARTSLLVAGLATLIALAIGSAVGLAAALAPAPIAAALRLVSDGMLGLPRMLLLLMLGTLLRGAPLAVALTLGLASWMDVGRLVEAESRSLRARPFFWAGVAQGSGRVRLAWRHLTPNLLPILSVAAPLIATEAVLLESTLSYLGVGVLDAISWGSIVADGQRLLPEGWWIAVFPGVLLCATAVVLREGVRN